MTRPTFTNGPPVPVLMDGHMDATTLRRMFAELAVSATILEVREKGAPTAYTGGDELTPDVALQGLLAGSTRAVQVRYRFADREWTDTIFTLPTGFRVVRCRHEHLP